MRKKLVFIGLAVAIALLAVVGCTSEQEATNPETATPTAPPATTPIVVAGSSQNVGIWVNGEGKVTVTPDLVILTLGIESQEETVAEAHRKAAEAMDAVMQALKNQGIADEDIQTSCFSIREVTRWLQDKEEVVGYRVINTVTTKVRELDKVGEIVDTVAAAGGDLTRVDSISFTVDDPTPYQAQAREKAIRDAMLKASQMAELAGVTLGDITYISEGGGSSVPRVYYDMKDGLPIPPTSAPGAVPTTPFSPGELEVTTTVNMVFDIR